MVYHATGAAWRIRVSWQGGLACSDGEPVVGGTGDVRPVEERGGRHALLIVVRGVKSGSWQRGGPFGCKFIMCGELSLPGCGTPVPFKRLHLPVVSGVFGQGSTGGVTA